MKKHSSKLLLIVLVLVLCLSTVVLAACNDDKNPPETPPVDTSVATSTMIEEIIDNITSSVGIGENFVVDLEAAFVLDDKTSNNNDVTYKLTGKGNVALQDGAKESDTDFAIEIVEQKGEAKKVLLGIAYEVIDNEPFFFINLVDSGYKKINGYSMTALYNLATGSATTQADGDGGLNLNIGEIVGLVMPILFGDKGKVENNVYTLRFDLAKTVGKIESMKDLVLGVLPNLGMTEDDLDALIAEYLGGLSYEQKGNTIHVSDLQTLLNFLKYGISLSGDVVFAFDANDKFVNASASFDFANTGEDVGNYTLRVDKMQIGPSDTAVDVFAGFPLTKDERANAQAVNLLNFSLKGNATAFDAENNIKHKYTIEVQSDIEPFALFDLLKGTDKANILATLKKLGYFHLEINEVFDKPAEGETPAPINIITLHSKFEEGFAVLNVHANKALIYNVGIGGVYDFDALIDVIGKLTAPSDEPQEPSDQPTEPAEETNIMDTLKTVISTIQDVLGYFTLDNMEEDGVTVALKDLVFMICDMVGLDTGGLTGTGISAILDCEKMNIQLQTPTHGTCTQVETSTIKCGIRQSSKLNSNGLSGAQTSFIKEIKSLDGFQGKTLQGDGALVKYLQGYVAFDKVFTMTGIDLAGNEVLTSGFIMAADGFDPNKADVQDVTLYIAVANDLLDLSSMLAVDDLIPLSGTLKFKTQIEVVAHDSNTSATVTGMKTETQQLFVGDNVFSKVKGTNPKITIDNKVTVELDNTMIRVFKGGKDVTDTVLNEKGNLTQFGEYNVKAQLFECIADICTIEVSDFKVKRVDGKKEVESLALGDSWEFGEYEIYRVDKDGNETKLELKDAPTYKIAGKDIKSTDIKDGKFYIPKDLAYVGNIVVTFKKVPTIGTSTTTKNFDIVSVGCKYTVAQKYSTLYFGNSLNGKFVLNVNDVPFNVVYKNNVWVAVAEDGTEQAITLTFKWKSATTGTAVTFDSEGIINNYPNEKKSSIRSTPVYYTLTVDGYTYTGNFTAYELYASNKLSAKVDSMLDGYISNVDRLPYTDGEGNAVELEFKFGAEGYAIYVKGTDTKVYDVTVKVTVDGTENEYQLTDGKFTNVGKYKVEYSLTINGIEQTFFHTVTVKA